MVVGKVENGLGSSSVKDSIETHRRLHPWKAAVDNCDPILFQLISRREFTLGTDLQAHQIPVLYCRSLPFGSQSLSKEVMIRKRREKGKEKRKRKRKRKRRNVRRCVNLLLILTLTLILRVRLGLALIWMKRIEKE